MYKDDLVLNNLKWLLSHKTQQKKPYIYFIIIIISCWQHGYP